MGTTCVYGGGGPPSGACPAGAAAACRWPGRLVAKRDVSSIGAPQAPPASSTVSVVVLDSGALIALERNDRSLWAALHVVASGGDEGRARTSDVCDAHVALVAGTRGDVLYTNDPGDMRRLLAAVGGRRPVIVRC